MTLRSRKPNIGFARRMLRLARTRFQVVPLSLSSERTALGAGKQLLRFAPMTLRLTRTRLGIARIMDREMRAVLGQEKYGPDSKKSPVDTSRTAL